MIQLKHLFKTIFRYRLSSGLTLLNLIIAFTGIVMLSLFVTFEYSFDRHYCKHDDVYILTFNESNVFLPAPIVDEIKSGVPEVLNAFAVSQWWENAIYKAQDSITDVVFADFLDVGEDFFSVFAFPLLHGNPHDALVEPKSVVLSKDLAHKVFGNENPLGEYVNLGNSTYKVTGVMDNLPKNTSFKCDALVSFSTYLQPGDDWRGAQTWQEWSFHIFLQLAPGTDRQQAVEKISGYGKIAELLDYAKTARPELASIVLLPINELHFSPHTFLPYVNKLVVDVLLVLAIVIAIMGAVNFINFSTSQAPLRAKKQAIQQVMGQRRWLSRWQIIGEAVFLSLGAMFIAIALHEMLYTYVQGLFGITGLEITGRLAFLIWFVLFAVVFGIMAGFYPSRYITSAPVSQMVKGKMNFSGKGKRFRQVLITLQFVFTIAMLVGAFTIEKQLRFWRNFDIGIDKENVIYLSTTSKIRNSTHEFAGELMKNENITDYAYSQFAPGSVGMGWGREVDGQYIQFKCWPVDDRFIDFFEIQIADGRKFNSGEGDINKFMLNQRAVEEFGWEKPLEKIMTGFDFTGEIVGVTKNFNFSSLHGKIEPMAFWRTDTRKNILFLRVRPGNFTQVATYIKETAARFDADNDVEIRFLDDYLNRLYDKEKKMAHFIEAIALWCMLLALVGLLGLTIFTTRDRTKEIGIRKINGATAGEIVSMLNLGFIQIVAFAFLIATPIAYYFMDRWLQNFAYRTALSWWVFVLVGLLALAIALLTVSWQSWRAANRNPVEALRYE